MDARSNKLSIGVFVLAAAVYANTLANEFVYDDQAAVVLNEAVRDEPFSLRRVMGTDFWGRSLATRRHTDTYRPLVVLSFAFDWRIGGGRPQAFHLTNLLIHASVCALLCRWLLARTSRAAASVGSILFAVHPLNTEAVASIVGRADMLMLLFGGLAWTLHRARGRLAAWAGAACFTAALLCKESAAALVCMMVLSDLTAKAGTRNLARYGLYFASMGCVLALRVHALGGVVGTLRPFAHNNPLVEAGAGERVFTALALFAKALSRELVPGALLPNYGPQVEPVSSAPGAWSALGLGFVIALGFTAFRCRGRSAGDASAWVLLFGAASVNGVVLLPYVFAERWWYPASAACCALLGEGVAWLLGQSGRPRLVAALLVLPMGVYATLTVQRNQEWRSNQTLFSAAVYDAPRCAAMQVAHASTLQDPAAALAACDRAAHDAPGWAEPQACRAMALAALGRSAEARTAYQQARLLPGWTFERRVQYIRFLIRSGSREEARRELSDLLRERWGRRAHGMLDLLRKQLE